MDLYIHALNTMLIDMINVCKTGQILVHGTE